MCGPRIPWIAGGSTAEVDAGRPGGGASCPMRVRDRRLDVAQGVLITLVAFGHLLPPVGLDDGLTSLA